MSSLTNFINKVEFLIIKPLIILLTGAALLMFFWGLTQFILNAGSEEGRTKGKSHMLWGIIGLLIIVGVYGILRILGGTFGFQAPTP